MAPATVGSLENWLSSSCSTTCSTAACDIFGGLQFIVNKISNWIAFHFWYVVYKNRKLDSMNVNENSVTKSMEKKPCPEINGWCAFH